MELIIGGAYQGKLDYAKEKLGVTDAYECTLGVTEMDLSKKCVTHLEIFALSCLRAGLEPRDVILARESEWRDCIFISDDISMGVVPIDAEMRAWREAVGRMLNALSGKAEHVHRVFLGIGQVLK